MKAAPAATLMDEDGATGRAYAARVREGMPVLLRAPALLLVKLAQLGGRRFDADAARAELAQQVADLQAKIDAWHRERRGRPHRHEAIRLALEHLGDGNTGPARYNRGDVRLGHFLVEQAVVAAAGGRGQTLFELGNRGVFELRGARQIALALCGFELRARRIEVADRPHR